uniref:Uncharacterized protein n=1 Tax=Eutreptiella gymnastica TaxID=73025 RepID=A0A7S1NH59_9EUGL
MHGSGQDVLFTFPLYSRYLGSGEIYISSCKQNFQGSHVSSVHFAPLLQSPQDCRRRSRKCCTPFNPLPLTWCSQVQVGHSSRGFIPSQALWLGSVTLSLEIGARAVIEDNAADPPRPPNGGTWRLSLGSALHRPRRSGGGLCPV